MWSRAGGDARAPGSTGEEREREYFIVSRGLAPVLRSRASTASLWTREKMRRRWQWRPISRRRAHVRPGGNRHKRKRRRNVFGERRKRLGRPIRDRGGGGHRYCLPPGENDTTITWTAFPYRAFVSNAHPESYENTRNATCALTKRPNDSSVHETRHEAFTRSRSLEFWLRGPCLVSPPISWKSRHQPNTASHRVVRGSPNVFCRVTTTVCNAIFSTLVACTVDSLRPITNATAKLLTLSAPHQGRHLRLSDYFVNNGLNVGCFLFKTSK